MKHQRIAQSLETQSLETQSVEIGIRPRVSRSSNSVRRTSTGRFEALICGLAALPLLAGASSAAPTMAAEPARVVPQAKRLDKVLRVVQRSRGSTVKTLSGTVTANTLTGVTLERDGKETDIKVDEVLRVVWGDVPIGYSDGISYANKGEHANAVALFQEVAGDSNVREVVRADARMRSAESMLAWGAIDAGQFSNCVDECDRFLSDYSDNREVPHVRWLKGRALRLSGDAAGAAAVFKGLHDEGANEPGTTGYDRTDCLIAGLDAAEAMLHSDQVSEAQTLYVAIENALSAIIAGISDEADPARVRLMHAQGRAAAGEGFCHLAADRIPQALTFFNGRLSSKDTPFAERMAATLGLAEVYAAQNKLRLAQLEYAKVAAVDHADRDRVSQALVGLARTTKALADTDSTASARRYLNEVKVRFGDTPAALEAAEMLKTL